MFIWVKSAEKLVYVNPTLFVVILAITGSNLNLEDSEDFGIASSLIRSPVVSPWAELTPTSPKNLSTLVDTLGYAVVKECAKPELDATP